MFTGIIEELGTVKTAGSRLTVACREVLSDLREGDSIAVTGVCLTAVGVTADSFSADLAPETLERSNLGALRAGALVNLERALLPTTRLSGHIVQGHVDGVATLLELRALPADNWWLRLEVPAELDRYLVYKGSIAIDGISLTVAAIEHRIVSVTVIPHTYHHTALRQRRPGDRLNIECDILAKHLEKLVLEKIGARYPQP